jgi:hypothetical protein
VRLPLPGSFDRRQPGRRRGSRPPSALSRAFARQCFRARHAPSRPRWRPELLEAAERVAEPTLAGPYLGEGADRERGTSDDCESGHRPDLVCMLQGHASAVHAIYP